MKKILSTIIAFVIMLNLSGLAAFAATEKSDVLSQEGMERIVKLVKAKIDIPTHYTQFRSEAENYDGKMLYRLYWNTDSSEFSSGEGRMSVSVDNQGIIQSFSNYKYGADYEYKRKLPKITKGNAAERARKFTRFMAPDIAEQLLFDDKSINCTMDFEGNYTINFWRQYKGIPFYENGISMVVNGSTGEINNYSRNWNEKLIFPDPEKAFSKEKAMDYYKNNIGLELKYRKTYGEEKDRTYLEYSPSTNNASSSVNAFTGEKVFENGNYSLYGNTGYMYDKYLRGKGQESKEINLTEQEMDELKELQGLISADKAEKLARGIEEFGIDSSYKLSRFIYYKNESSGGYALRLIFGKTINKDDIGIDIPQEKLNLMIAAGEFGRTAEITFNAKTSEVVSFNSYGKLDNNMKKEPYKRDDLQKVAENFLKEYKTEKYKQSALQNTSDGFNNYYRYAIPYYEGTSSFIYTRMVNGIKFEDNQMSFNFDLQTGKITYYSENWDNIEFIPVTRAISIDKAYDALYRQNSLGLRYVTAQPSGEIRLVYGFSINKPLCLDAEKGILINYFNAEPYIEMGETRYKDIEKHPAKEQIQTLAEIGMLPADDRFNPDKPITQKDWLNMLGKVKGSYYMETGSEISSQKELDGMYRMMINEGILNEDEKDPDGVVTHENAVKYLLNAIGYKKFAQLEGIFKCDFADKDQIDPRLIGYAAIAKSLKLTEENKKFFNPKDQLTRAEAAVMIYNYMKN